MNRFLDIIGSFAGLILSVPLWPIVALAIKLETKGPVLARLARISGGKTIYVYKFRSMIDGAHPMKTQLQHLNERQDGPFFKIKNDPRLTRSGKLIRKFRFDEIPQFINVLKGEMALVGPRPHEPEEIARYPESYRHIPIAKAGITGLSQVSGASNLPFLQELEMDARYLKNKSLGLDLKIIAKTAAILFFDPSAV
ncbi:MAG: sugar transferase [Patescibacteria group bacterium]